MTTATRPPGSASGTSRRIACRAPPVRTTAGRWAGASATSGASSGAESGQYDPLITQDNTIIGVPEGTDGKEFYLPDALTDHALTWLHTVRAQDPAKPWFMYYSTGCAHAPHHVPAEWSEKYRGRFDQGWDRLREETFERQKLLGVVPQDAVLTPRPELFPAWDTLSDNEKQLYARQMEVYAGFQENADANVGRLLDAVEEMGELDNTLVIYIFGDNGASLEGTVTGSFNEMTMGNGIPLTPEQQLSLIGQYGGLDAWGTDATAPHYSAAWAWAGNAPFQWGKQVGSHLGGTRDGMVLAWPERIRDRGSLRSQFTHCTDIGPTILEAAGIPQAVSVDGIEQEPMHGTSFVYTFDDAGAAERHTVQYWETFGNRAIYKDGWWACAKLDRIPWDGTPATIARFAPGKYDPEQDTWELYYLPDDFSQAHDLAAEHPERLAELKELFWQEAERNHVLPLLSGLCVFFGILPPMPTVTRTTFYGDVQNIASGMIPRVYGRSYAIEAELVDPGGRRRGRHRGGGRRDGRLLALGRRRPTAAPHLLVHGRSSSTCRSRQTRCPRATSACGCSSMPTRRGRARAATSRSGRTARRSARGGWTAPWPCASRSTQAWTSGATTA